MRRDGISHTPTMMRASAFIFAAVAFLAFSGSAHAEFRFCNGTASRIGVAVGHKDSEGWVSEGWWNIEPSDCRTVLKGPLQSRYYYVYAIDYDQGGEWGGETIMCTKDTSFTIRGIGRCEQRGMTSSGFYEVDTGEHTSWTVQLLDNAITEGAPQ